MNDNNRYDLGLVAHKYKRKEVNHSHFVEADVKIRQDIIYKSEIVCFVPNNRIYFIRNNKLFWAIRKQGMNKSFGTLQDRRKRISIKKETIHELGLVEESFLKEVIDRSVFWKDKDFCEGDN